MLSKEYSCAGKADTYFIPSYNLPDHMEPTEDRRRCYSDMVKEKKAGRLLYVKRWKEVESIRLPKDDGLDLCEPCGHEVEQARLENFKLRTSRKELDQGRRGSIVPEIKIDRINPGLQRMKPTEWTFEAASGRRKTSAELVEEEDDMLSPCTTKISGDPFTPVVPLRSKSAPSSTKQKEKTGGGKLDQKRHKGLKFWRRRSA